MTVSNNGEALRLAGNVLLLARSLDQQVRQASDRDALALTELGVLSQVSRGTDAPTAIARAMRLDPARITHLSDRLVAHGYLARSLYPGDRRRCRLRLTESGAERLQTGRSDTEAATQRLLAGMTKEEVEGLTLGLEGARRVLSALPVLAKGATPDVPDTSSGDSAEKAQ